MKLKDYDISQYGPGDDLDSGDLHQYNLKNFDLKAYRRDQERQDPDHLKQYDPKNFDPMVDRSNEGFTSSAQALVAAVNPEASHDSIPGEMANPVPSGYNPYLLKQETAPSATQDELNRPVLDPCEVQISPNFYLQTLSCDGNPFSPPQPWKMPRWAVAMIGLFFGSAAALTLTFCVVLLRESKAAPQAQLVAPAPLATTSARPVEPSANSVDVSRAVSANQKTNIQNAPVDRAAVRPSGTAVPRPTHDDSALAHRVAVSRHPAFVRRSSHGSRRIAHNSEGASAAREEGETASSRPAQDDLDKLLGASAL